MRTIVILNPAARNGKAGRLQARIASMLTHAGLDVDVRVTPDAKATIHMAGTAATESDLVVAVGGDGTIHQVANGVITAGTGAALGIIPLGTGNDFVKMLKIPLHLESAIKILAKGKRKAVDYGTVVYQTKNDEQQRYFINTLGVGFDAEVGHRATSFKVLPGFLAYLAALLNTLQKLRHTEATVILDGPEQRLLYEGPLLLSSVGNGSTSGGLFKLTPHAMIDDGFLDACAISRISVAKLLRSVPKVLRGSHTNMKEYHAGRAKKVIINVTDTDTFHGMPLHADGEILGLNVSRLEVELVAKGISVIVP